MAVDLEQYLSEKLSSLPLDHPDRVFLEGMQEVASAYNSRTSDNGRMSATLVEPERDPFTVENKESYLLDRYPSLELLFYQEPSTFILQNGVEKTVDFWISSPQTSRRLIDAAAVSLFLETTDGYDDSYDDPISRKAKILKLRRDWEEQNPKFALGELESYWKKTYLTKEGLVDFLWYVHQNTSPDFKRSPLHVITSSSDIAVTNIKQVVKERGQGVHLKIVDTKK